MEETNTGVSEKGSKVSPMMIVAIVVIVAVVGIGAMLFKGKSATNTNSAGTSMNGSSNSMKQQNTPTTAVMSPAPSGSDSAMSETTLTIEGGNFYFKPNKLTVKKGQKVKLVFNNAGGFHNLMIDELNVKTNTIKGVATDTVEFTPEKTGTFEFYCSVGNHRQMGMKGTITVE